MLQFEERRILVLGKTYPSLSRKYDEITCVGGLVEPDLQMVRLHPINFNELTKAQRFHDWQWIRARIGKHESDTRPESYRIDIGSIQPDTHVRLAAERTALLCRCPAQFRSMDELQSHNQAERTSLGIVAPKAIANCRVRHHSEEERGAWQAKSESIRAQAKLFGPRPRDLDFPEFEFLIQWRCSDPSCSGHEMVFHDWGIQALSRKYRGKPDHDEKVLKLMASKLDLTKRRVSFMLGNFLTHMTTFSLMGILSVEREARDLFSTEEQP